MFDVIIVGGGPAGMTAALYALRNGKSALVLEKNGFGGQITYSPKVENYPGTLSMSGNEYAEKCLEQILEQGAEVELDKVTGVEKSENGIFAVRTEEGNTWEGRTVILATGVEHRMLGVDGEYDLVGSGLSFCAVCDGDFYAGQTVCVAGGGNSALQEAILLAGKCKEVIMLQDLDLFTGEKRLQDVLFARENVKAICGCRIIGFVMNDADPSILTGIRIEDRKSGKQQVVPCDGLFVAIGLVPKNDDFAALASLNSYGYFDSDESCLTKTPGLFVAGDCRSKLVRQVTTANADGAIAALAACRYIDQM